MPVFRIVGGDVALDLVNTVEPRIPGLPPERDHLGSPGALLDWAERAEVIDPAERRRVAAAWRSASDGGAGALNDALRLRAAVGTAMDAARGATGRSEEASALRVITQRAAEALGRSELVPDPERRHPARRAVGTEPAALLVDRLAVAAAELLQTADLPRLKACPPEEGGCGWLFLDTSKNGSRRWCSMEDCGARVKARRLTERRRDARSAAR